MIKKCLFLILLFNSFFTYAQTEYKFAGLDWFQSKEKAVQKLSSYDSMAYYQEIPVDTHTTLVFFSGILYGKDGNLITLYITDDRLMAVKLTIPTHGEPFIEFASIHEALSEKYGPPEATVQSLQKLNVYPGTPEAMLEELKGNNIPWGAWWNTGFSYGNSSLYLQLNNDLDSIEVSYSTDEFSLSMKQKRAQNGIIEDLF